MSKAKKAKDISLTTLLLIATLPICVAPIIVISPYAFALVQMLLVFPLSACLLFYIRKLSGRKSVGGEEETKLRYDVSFIGFLVSAAPFAAYTFYLPLYDGWLNIEWMLQSYDGEYFADVLFWCLSSVFTVAGIISAIFAMHMKKRFLCILMLPLYSFGLGMALLGEMLYPLFSLGLTIAAYALLILMPIMFGVLSARFAHDMEASRQVLKPRVILKRVLASFSMVLLASLAIVLLFALWQGFFGIKGLL
jgi:hypothetical protein